MDGFTLDTLGAFAQAERDPVIADVLLRRMCEFVKAGRYHHADRWHPQDDAQFEQAYRLMQRQYPVAVRRLEGVMCACKFQIRDAPEATPPVVEPPPIPVTEPTRVSPIPRLRWWHALYAVFH